MAPSNATTFVERLAYARMLKHFVSGEAPSNADIGRAVGRTGQWVTKWAASDGPPRDYEVHDPLARYLGVDERWLIRDIGDPPRPELWAVWIAARRKSAREFRDATKEGQRGASAQRGGATKKREA